MRGGISIKSKKADAGGGCTKLTHKKMMILIKTANTYV